MSNISHIFPRDFSYTYREIEWGEGIYLYDSKGNKYLDACSGAAVVNLGHGNKEIAEVIYNQAQKLAFVHSSRFTTKPAIELSEKVAAMSPGDLNTVYFVSGGSEATETAIKLARQYFLERDGKSNKYKIISRWTSYHGNTLGALSVSGKPGLMKKYDPLLLNFPHIDSAYCYRCEYGLDPDICNCPCAKSLEKTILREGPENIAGFIFEPVTGSASPGSYPKKDYYKIIRELCDKYDILMIADEVMNGFGRTGENFGIDNFDVIPDIICIAKGISSGYAPLGGIVASDKIVNIIKNGSGKFTHGHTYSANPLSCAVGCKTLEIIEREKVKDNAKEKGKMLLNLLIKELAASPIIGDIRGLGLQLGIEFVKNKETKEPFEKSISGKITEIGLKKGIVLYPGSGNADTIKGDNILLTPPLIITEEQVYEIVEKLKETFNEAVKEIHK